MLAIDAKTVILLLLLMVLESGCQRNGPISAGSDPEPGIALDLATQRVQAVDKVRYGLSFTLPAAVSESIIGRAVIRFELRDDSRPLVLDFARADHLTSVSSGGKPVRFRSVNGHIVIPMEEIHTGENALELVFRPDDAALNRNPDFLYTLFVPARAHLAFPCFDQPDLKARFTLDLTVPPGWQAVANGAEAVREPVTGAVRIHYRETPPISTYLFAFAAGKFEVETAERGGRTYRMFHRETDAAKVARNRDAVFDLHASALAWLEHYTAIPYRFGKFDFVVIPSFQFGGMEHPGAIFYNAASVLLDESATENQMLNRASTIAHETSHMWFGDLVTMRWFNDVWMKEVFANFMAAKIVNPSFPNVNHELRFLVSHYPAAYAVDRTAGTHPIRQDLANLNEAGSLYGPIIYEKAPIVMRQLERILGADRLQEGLRRYLTQFEFGNATWLDLIRTLDERADAGLPAWSHAWVEEAGRPTIHTNLQLNLQRGIQRLSFTQADTQQRSLRWIQQMQVLIGTSAGLRSFPVELRDEQTEVTGVSSLPNLQFVLPTGGGLAYGDFVLDPTSRTFLLRNLPTMNDPVARGAAWVTLWDELLERRIRPLDFLDLATRALPQEDTEQNVQLALGYLTETFWRFIPDSKQRALSATLEQMLLTELARAKSSSLKSTYFSAFRSIVTTKEGIAFLERVWRRQEKIPGLNLAEPDEATMALELAVREVATPAAILEEQRRRFMNPDRKARFEFVMPALSVDQDVRDAFFRSLLRVENRRHEPWVLEGLRYLNHPLRASQSEKYLRPALDLLREIQRTGDIFFPKNWMDATLGGHNTRTAAQAVHTFLSEQSDYPIRLRRIILQSADDLFSAVKILEAEPGLLAQ